MKANEFLATALLVFGLIAVGCSSGTHVVTGVAHPRLPVEAVQVYSALPQRCEVVGLVNARARGERQLAMDAAIQELKLQAAKMGANGVIVTLVESDGLGDRRLKVSGQAVFVPALAQAAAQPK